MNEDCTFSERRDLFIDKSPLSQYEVINVGSIATNLVQGTLPTRKIITHEISLVISILSNIILENYKFSEILGIV